MRLAVLLLLVSAGAAETHVVETEHYALHTDGPRETAEEYSFILQAFGLA